MVNAISYSASREMTVVFVVYHRSLCPIRDTQEMYSF